MMCNMITPKKSPIGWNIKLSFVKSNKLTKNSRIMASAVATLLSRNHLKNQEDLKLFFSFIYATHSRYIDNKKQLIIEKKRNTKPHIILINFLFYYIIPHANHSPINIELMINKVKMIYLVSVTRFVYY